MGQVLSGYESLRGGNIDNEIHFVEYLAHEINPSSGLVGGLTPEEEKRRDELLLESVTRVTYPIVNSSAEVLQKNGIDVTVAKQEVSQQIFNRIKSEQPAFRFERALTPAETKVVNSQIGAAVAAETREFLANPATVAYLQECCSLQAKETSRLPMLPVPSSRVVFPTLSNVTAVNVLPQMSVAVGPPSSRLPIQRLETIGDSGRFDVSLTSNLGLPSDTTVGRRKSRTVRSRSPLRLPPPSTGIPQFRSVRPETLAEEEARRREIASFLQQDSSMENNEYNDFTNKYFESIRNLPRDIPIQVPRSMMNVASAVPWPQFSLKPVTETQKVVVMEDLGGLLGPTATVQSPAGPLEVPSSCNIQ